jgi:hypothetical protein
MKKNKLYIYIYTLSNLIRLLVVQDELKLFKLFA